MGNPFQGILNGVGVVVHGVDAPFVTGAVVGHMVNAVNHRVPHVKLPEAKSILARRVILPSSNSPARIRAKRSKLSAMAGPIGAGGGGGEVAAVFPHLVRVSSHT